MDSSPKWHAAPLPLEEARQTFDLRSLSTLHKGARGRVSRVVENAAGTTAPLAPADFATAVGDDAEPSIVRRLIELGFVAGERIEVIGEAQPGGDPIAVRIGASIFALRRREAHAVMVQVESA
jgi:ferrous iron transport protein A